MKKLSRNFGIILPTILISASMISCSQNIEEIINKIEEINTQITNTNLSGNKEIDKYILQLKSLYKDWKINQNRILYEWASFAQNGDKDDEYTNKWIHLIFLNIATKFQYYLTNILQNNNISAWEKWKDELQNFHFEYEIYYRESFIETIFEIIKKDDKQNEQNIYKLQSLIIEIQLIINKWKLYKSNDVERQEFAINKKQQKFSVLFSKIKELGNIKKENYFYEFYTRLWKVQSLIKTINSNPNNSKNELQLANKLLLEINNIYKRWNKKIED